MNRRRQTHRAFWLLAVMLGTGPAVLAGDDQRGASPALLPKYTQECGACHVPFPPRMLPADSWQRLMSNLPRHYGTDASLDAATMNQIATWLNANAGTGKRAREAPPEDRITRSAWFVREHDEVPAAVWKRAAVKGPVNCIACHAQADQGNFDEHRVRIPR